MSSPWMKQTTTEKGKMMQRHHESGVGKASWVKQRAHRGRVRFEYRYTFVGYRACTARKRSAQNGVPYLRCPRARWAASRRVSRAVPHATPDWRFCVRQPVCRMANTERTLAASKARALPVPRPSAARRRVLSGLGRVGTACCSHPQMRWPVTDTVPHTRSQQWPPRHCVVLPLPARVHHTRWPVTQMCDDGATDSKHPQRQRPLTVGCCTGPTQAPRAPSLRQIRLHSYLMQSRRSRSSKCRRRGIAPANTP